MESSSFWGWSWMPHSCLGPECRVEDHSSPSWFSQRDCSCVVRHGIWVLRIVVDRTELFLFNNWTDFDEAWKETSTQGPLPSLWFSGQLENKDGSHGLWLADTFSTSPLQTAEQNLTKLDKKQVLNSLYQFFSFRSMGKQRWPPCPPIGNFFHSGRWENKDGRPVLQLAETFFSFFFWNHWMKFDEIWEEASTQNVLSQVGVCRLIAKQRWTFWPLIGLDMFGFSFKTPEQSLMKLDRKQVRL